MPTQRIWYPGAIYHVTNRGINHMKIFLEEEDFQTFLKFTKYVLEKYNAILHNYCLMDNHYHLLIETTNEPITKIMKNIKQRYTLYFNKKYNRVNSLFGGRYRAELVENDVYFLEACRYIALNPVRECMVEKPEEYRWSSYRTYLEEMDDGIIYKEKTLKYFKNEIEYKKFIEDGLKEL